MTTEEIVDWLEDQFTNRAILREIYEKLCKKRWILQDDVLALLDNYKLIPVEKWQEIVGLLKNRPKPTDEKYSTYHGFHIHYNRDLDKFFEVLEAKVAELKEAQK